MAAPVLLCAVASERRRAKMEGEKRERWMRFCVEAADEQDSNRLFDIFSEVNRLLHEKSCGSEMCDEKQASTLSKLLRKRHPSRAGIAGEITASAHGNDA